MAAECRRGKKPAALVHLNLARMERYVPDVVQTKWYATLDEIANVKRTTGFLLPLREPDCEPVGGQKD